MVLTTKPLKVYQGNKQIGVIQGYFDNIRKKFIDELVGGVPIFLKHELKDQFGNTRLLAKPRTFKGQIAITYFDGDNSKCEILMKNAKNVRFVSKTLNFQYKDEDYIIIKKESLKRALSLTPEPAKMFVGERLIADWNIDVGERSIVVHIFDTDYIDEHLIIGLFHAFLYPTKG
ncbi:hypothetical protein [Paraliobacillus zengyii]|uniref:tubby C-terminal domain-like protein n=1 Tax=Paraliobacillus zengyii TaxID=2213194 RepID=UPI000E3BB9DC|nr:hypothetical protein [Paraliobacillus zengyii]